MSQLTIRPEPSVVAIVVSYHPENSVVTNIRTLLGQVSQVVIVNNESTEQSVSLLSTIEPSDRIFCIHNSTNRGVGEGFNQGLRWGLESGYQYFLLMDQDSSPTPGMVRELLSALQNNLPPSGLIVVGPHHEDFLKKLPNNKSPPCEPASLLISSGSLIPRKVLEEVGLYDERLFIDHVDHDFSIRVWRKGGTCLRVNSSTLLHKFGEAKTGTIFGKSFFIQNYSPTRRYYMMRNRIILYRRYGMFRDSWFWLDLRSALKDLIKLLLFEPNKASKLKGLLRGFWDGLHWV